MRGIARDRSGRPLIVLGVSVALVFTGRAAEAPHVGIQRDGSVLLPTDQTIRPAGRLLNFEGHPTAIAIHPDGRTAAVLKSRGTWFFFKNSEPILVIDLATGRIIQRFLPYDSADAGFTGIAYSPDGTKLYASDSGGAVMVANVAADGTLAGAAKISLPVPDPMRGAGMLYPDGSHTADPGGLALSANGRLLYVALNMNNSLAVVDLATNSVTGQIPVGNAPHAVVVNGSLAYVSNQGGRVATPSDYTNLSADTAISADPATGRPTTGAVSVVDLNAGKVVASIAVGLQPTAMLLHEDMLFVANTNSDTVSVIDTRSREVVKTISMQPFFNAPFGSSPNAMAMLADGRLIVSLGANNALAVFDWKGPSAAVSLLGLIPTAWYPSDVAVDRKRNQLVVAALKGFGYTGAEIAVTGFDPAVQKTRKTARQLGGLVALVKVPDRKQLAEQTRQVVAGNRWNTHDENNKSLRPAAAPKAVPERIGEPSLIKHVFYIIKENQTYDQVLGDQPKGNGAPANVEFGRSVTPNHHALAAEFPLLDNFYVSSTASADGHQWATSAFVVDYIERGFVDLFRRAYPFNGGDSLAYAPSGFVWENALHHRRSVRVFGEYAARFEGQKKRYGQWADWYRDTQVMEGKRPGTLHVALGEFQARSDVPSLDALLNRQFPGFDTAIPDQYRADVFLSEFDRHVANRDLQDLTIITVCNDHTSGVAPGLPIPRAQVADNDLALGRVVEAISSSPYWMESAIFVVEDDAANGVDHVDGHRSPAFVISPYARRRFVDHSYYTQIDVVRTIEQILGLPPMNQNDLGASLMRTAFTDTADLEPYKALPNEIPLDEMNQVHAANRFRRAWELATAKMFSVWPPVPDTDENLLNRAIWYVNFNFARPYPGDDRMLLPSEVRRSRKKKDD
jgi:YVTN family beta-propeller protein